MRASTAILVVTACAFIGSLAGHLVGISASSEKAAPLPALEERLNTACEPAKLRRFDLEAEDGVVYTPGISVFRIRCSDGRTTAIVYSGRESE